VGLSKLVESCLGADAPLVTMGGIANFQWCSTGEEEKEQEEEVVEGVDKEEECKGEIPGAEGEESHRLRPSSSAGFERVLSKDVLQSVRTFNLQYRL